MTQYLIIFVAGFAGSFHCLGMCGGFACALGADPSGRRGATVARHLLYNTGRVVTYVFMGALAASLAGALVAAGTPQALVTAQRGLAVVAGLLMIVMALQLFGLLQRRHRPVLGAVGAAPAPGAGGGTLVASLRGLLAAPGPAAPLSFGVLNGFLPCPLVYAFVAHAAAQSVSAPGNPVATGALVMAAFGLGTFPAMLGMGWLGRALGPVWRRRGVRLAAAFILVLGLVTLARGVIPLTAHGLAP